MVKNKLLIVIVLCMFSITLSLSYLAMHEMNKPVGLFVVRPDIEFFECAKAVHGNYVFYYDQGRKEFMFDRGGEQCYVDIMLFRTRYLKMFGRTNEIFVGGE